MIDQSASDDLTVPADATRRDRYGRYLVVPPEGGKPTGYTRATTIAKTLDDTSNLMSWGQRMVALGLAARPDLLALIQSCGDDKEELNKLCDRAKEAGGATARRDLGTALHSILERSWTEEGYTPPDAYAADVTAVLDALAAHSLEPVDGMHERIVVHDGHRIAGKPDLFLRRPDGSVVVADVKTGASVVYGAGSWAVQLGIYATADALYTQGAAKDGSEDERHPMPAVDASEAVIIHVEPASGVCNLHTLDLTVGIEALDLAMSVREFRRAKPLSPLSAPIQPADDITQDVETKVAPDRQAYLFERIDAIKAHGAGIGLARRWPGDVRKRNALDGGNWSAYELDAIEAIVAEVEQEFGVTFPESLPPGTDTYTPKPPLPEPRPLANEGDTMDEASVEALSKKVGDLDPDARAWVLAIAADAKRVGRPIAMKVLPSRRRFAIIRALWLVAQVDPDDALLRALCGAVMGEEVQPAVALGMAVGSLTIDEAEHLARLAPALGDAISVAYEPDESIRLVGDLAAFAA